ncbi:hypothetical protein [Cerasicoccus arenae]|uniref:Uncharacterized protein n=1 Tax=Cerasicoccus arenae TaxID=424488 RepID=A0A8J3GDF4_9BACT|nr:hypothetical protein [Cerasicoccus arenae]MBK1859178.1 hypothetical protein [Cerasicoccus arenae]GHC01092.1 hypothetical protein GCM10007047_16880 [Cerasicoccus arenae]
MSFGLHHALREVRQLKRHILTKQRFKGYSGRARALGGCAALAAALILRGEYINADLPSLLSIWGAVLALGLSLNYGALVYWFLYDEEVGRDWHSLKPALEVLPAFAVGALATVACIQQGCVELLPGLWMSLYGLANLASRHVLPHKISWIGGWYIAAGGACLLWPVWAWTQPLAMGGVFFVGEWLGGLVLHNDEAEGRTVWSFFGLPNLSQNYE